jgi:hypothetical protein
LIKLQKSTIASAGNVLVPAYLALQQRGFTEHGQKADDSGEGEMWVAENQFVRLVAEDPLILLGLAALYETRGSEWQAEDDQIEEFLAKYAN